MKEKTILKKVPIKELIDYIEFEKSLNHKKDYDDLLILTKENFQKDGDVYLISPTENVVVGFAVPHFVHKEHLTYLYVSPFYRGMGFALRAINELKIKNVCTLPGNKEAIKFYEKAGFKINKDESSEIYLLLER